MVTDFFQADNSAVLKIDDVGFFITGDKTRHKFLQMRQVADIKCIIYIELLFYEMDVIIW